MITQSNDISAAGIDIKSLSTLIIELNIARRNSLAYPKGHPVIAASLAKVLHVYDELLDKLDELILGITSDALMVDGVILEKTNVVYRDFARALFERGIGAIMFHRGLTTDELTNFTAILGLKREHIHQNGGIEEVWSKANFSALSIRPIRYDLFQSIDADSVNKSLDFTSGEGLWAWFTRELTLGELPEGSSGDIYLDPEILAEVLNQQFDSGIVNKAELQTAISVFLASSDTVDSSSGDVSGQIYKKLATFISNLTPELRRQFLDSSFGDKSQVRQTAAERIINHLSKNAILETLEDINHNHLNVSSVVFGLLQRLGLNVSSSQNFSEELFEDNDIPAKMKTIFREHASEEFVPDDYQKKLNYIISSDQIPRLNMEGVTDLLITLDNHSVESSIGQILMNLIRDGIETPEERDQLLRNLSDMFGFFLQTGDYARLHSMVDQMNDGTFPVEIQDRLRSEYGRREYLDEILDGLTTWGKPRYDDIRSLIHKIREPFIETILDRLAEEKNMSLRRFYMDCLIELGPLTRLPIVNRLHDTRWYFLRNLLIILTAQHDPAIIPAIKPLLRHNDPRLRHEALKALVHFRDSHAEKQILEDLDDHNLERQNTAIQLAERCKSPEIAGKLTSMLLSGGFSQTECDRKSAIIHTLGEIGRAEVLPDLAKFLSSRSLLRSRQLTKLKTDIISSLPKYPPTISRPILERISGSSGEMAQLAAETLKIISGKHS